MKRIFADTSYWIALFNPRDELHARAVAAAQSHSDDQMVTSELVSEGRVYGGGLHKVEPKELAQIPARGVLKSINTHIRIEQQERLFG